MKIDHVNISAPLALLEQVRDFYCQVLGLTDGFRPGSDIKGFWLYSEGKAFLHLVESDKHFASEKQGYLDHVAFQSAGLDAMVEALESKGIPYNVHTFTEANMTQLFFRDPAGIGVEVNFLGEFLKENLNI